jgi:hypothetical protein
MIFIEWYHTDWNLYLPVIIGIILIVILFLRILRRLTRWGPVSVSHVIKQKIEFQNTTITIYQHQIPSETNNNESGIENLDPASLGKNLLLIPPLSVNGEHNYHLAVSLAITGWKVVVLTPNQVNHIINIDNLELFNQMIQEFNITKAIIFDYAIPNVIQILLNVNIVDNSSLPLSNINWCFIRPMLNWLEIKHWYQILPLSAMWWSRLKLMQFNPTSKIVNNQISEISNLVKVNLSRFFFIEPQISWLTHQGQNQFNDLKMVDPEQEHGHFFKINDGGWSFYRQETLVLGYILKILDT